MQESKSGKFLISFSQAPKQPFFSFDYFFDLERLSWGLLTEKLEYRLKMHYDAQSQQIYMPTTEVSQVFFVQDLLVSTIDKERDLNKHLRLYGPSSSSKSVILHTFASKMSTPVKPVFIPMSAYLTTDKMLKVIEESYVAKRRDYMVPKDPKKKIVFVIDDVHLQRNLKVEILEFIRTWSVRQGYFDLQAGIFKNIGEFSTIIAENSEFQSTNNKQDRFL